MRQFSLIMLAGLLAVSCGSKDTKEKPAAPAEPLPVNSNDNTKQDNSGIPKTVLSLGTQDVSGDLGQITFTQNEKTVFFYNLKSKKGTVVLNGAPQTLDQYSFDSKTGSYTLSGSTVTINAPDCKFRVNKGEDCNYGQFSAVTIAMGKDTLTVNNVAVQDCPDY